MSRLEERAIIDVEMRKMSRTAMLVAGAGLVVAWLAVAANPQRPPEAVAQPSGDETSLARAERLAGEIEAQSTRLRTHLAAAPQPSPSGRNPFRFEARPAPPRARISESRTPAFDNEPAAISIPEPVPLTLSGIAEEIAGAGNAAVTIRTAVLAGLGDVFLAKAGDLVASRYRITTVGADAVEMIDLDTGRTIRLGLR